MLRYVHHLDPLLCLDNDLLPCVECDVSAFATQKHLQASIMCVYRNYVIYVRTIMRGVMCHPYYHYQEIGEILQGLCPDRHVLRVAVLVCLGCFAWSLGHWLIPYVQPGHASLQSRRQVPDFWPDETPETDTEV